MKNFISLLCFLICSALANAIETQFPIRTQKLTTYPAYSPFPWSAGQPIRALVSDPGLLWMADAKSFHKLHLRVEPAPFSGLNLRRLRASKSSIYGLTEGGDVWRFDREKLNWQSLALSVQVVELFGNAQEGVFALTENGLIALEKWEHKEAPFWRTDFTAFLKQVKRFAKPVCAVAVHGQRLWAQTPEGLYIFRAGVADEFLPLPSDAKRCQLQSDPDGSIWIAGAGFGLVRYSSGKIERLTDTVQRLTQVGIDLKTTRIVALTIDDAGNLWFGTEAGKLIALADTPVSSFTDAQASAFGLSQVNRSCAKRLASSNLIHALETAEFIACASDSALWLQSKKMPKTPWKQVKLSGGKINALASVKTALLLATSAGVEAISLSNANIATLLLPAKNGAHALLPGPHAGAWVRAENIYHVFERADNTLEVVFAARKLSDAGFLSMALGKSENELWLSSAAGIVHLGAQANDVEGAPAYQSPEQSIPLDSQPQDFTAPSRFQYFSFGFTPKPPISADQYSTLFYHQKLDILVGIADFGRAATSQKQIFLIKNPYGANSTYASLCGHHTYQEFGFKAAQPLHALPDNALLFQHEAGVSRIDLTRIRWRARKPLIQTLSQGAWQQISPNLSQITSFSQAEDLAITVSSENLLEPDDLEMLIDQNWQSMQDFTAFFSTKAPGSYAQSFRAVGSDERFAEPVTLRYEILPVWWQRQRTLAVAAAVLLLLLFYVAWRYRKLLRMARSAGLMAEALQIEASKKRALGAQSQFLGLAPFDRYILSALMTLPPREWLTDLEKALPDLQRLPDAAERLGASLRGPLASFIKHFPAFGRNPGIDWEAFADIPEDARNTELLWQSALPSKGGYLLLSEITGGGMAKVQRAMRKSDAQIVVLKTVPPSFPNAAIRNERLAKEINKLQLLTHSNIVAYIDHFEESAQSYLVMEFIEGNSMAEVGRATVEQATRWAFELRSALEYAHSEGIVHRDIKPANVIIDLSGGARLIDFGLAQSFENPTQLTVTGEHAMTPIYAAPEQWTRDADEDDMAACDWWALGVTLAECLLARPLWKYPTPAGLQPAFSAGKVPEFCDEFEQLPADWNAFLNSLLVFDPEQRVPRWELLS